MISVSEGGWQEKEIGLHQVHTVQALRAEEGIRETQLCLQRFKASHPSHPPPPPQRET